MCARLILQLAMAEWLVSVLCPASILQFHPNATVVIDSTAASQLILKDFNLTIHPRGEDQDLL